MGSSQQHWGSKQQIVVITQQNNGLVYILIWRTFTVLDFALTHWVEFREYLYTGKRFVFFCHEIMKCSGFLSKLSTETIPGLTAFVVL